MSPTLACFDMDATVLRGDCLLAAARLRPSNYHYGAAKAALTALCEGLLLRFHVKPFAVRIIKARFMATPMTMGKAPPALSVRQTRVCGAGSAAPPQQAGHRIPALVVSPMMLLIRRLPDSIASKL